MTKIEFKETAIKQLFQIAKHEGALARRIHATIYLIAKKSNLGTLIRNNQRVYTEPHKTFRISYLIQPKTADILIVQILLTRSGTARV